MNFHPGINPGAKLVNKQICEIFKCSPQGGMRRSLSTNTLVIVSNHVSSIYDDRWVGHVLHYTGMGQSGDQTIHGTQNRTLAEHDRNGVAVHLFEVFQGRTYVYMGQVALNEKPYQEQQPDADGGMRRVWMFPLAVVTEDATVPPISVRVLLDLQSTKQRAARKLPTPALALRALSVPSKVGSRPVVAEHYDENPWVAEYVQRRAKGICDLCASPAPFEDRTGLPYLEIHHIESLSTGTTCSVDNTVALCPNCCRKMQILDPASDRRKLKNAAAQKINH